MRPFTTERLASRVVSNAADDKTGMKRYIVTGAPGAGKTAVIRQLELDGFSVVEEAATDVIALSQAKGVAEPWTRPEFIDAIVSLQRIRELRSASVTEVVQFHDRSVVCTAALAEYLEFPRPQSLLQELERLKTQSIFQTKVIFLAHLGFVTRTEARRISYEEAMRFEAIHERTYRDLGFEIVYIGAGSVLDRVRELKRVLSLGGVG
jgi:predicted ATPase